MLKKHIFQRKVYDRLLLWKEKYAQKYACLLEGARRVRKTTIAEYFAQNEYKSYIKIDFANITEEVLDIFRDIANLDIFFYVCRLKPGSNLSKENRLLFLMKFNYIPKQDRQLNTTPNISLAQTREADKLEADLGYLYENVVAQMLTANEKDLYYHTWRKK